MRAVNLLPPDMRGASKATVELGAGPEAKGGSGPFVVLGVLAALVAGTAGYVLTTNDVKQRKADLAEVNARQQALESKAAQLKPFADFESMANDRIKTVRDLAGSRFDWARVLRDLSRAVPANVTLSELVGNVSTDTGGGGGGASSPLRGSIAAPAITLTGCTTDQTSVARVMARLRNVDGVTRVALSKSDNNKVDASASSASDPNAAQKAAPCGSGTHPQFEMVAFFGRASAASVAPGAAPPAAGSSTSPSASATPAPQAGASATATPAASSQPGATQSSTTSTTTPAQGGAKP